MESKKKEGINTLEKSLEIFNKFCDAVKNTKSMIHIIRTLLLTFLPIIVETFVDKM